MFFKPHRSLFIAGLNMHYEPDTGDNYRRLATSPDKILNSAKPTDIPIEQPTRFDFVISLQAVKQIDLTIAPNVLARADQVIK